MGLVRSWRGKLIGVMTVLVILTEGTAPKSLAKDLTSVLARGMEVNALTFNPNVAAQIAPALSGAVGQAVTQQVPFSSVSPAFTYRYNTAVDIWERATAVAGPLFSERAQTLGKGRLNFGIGYLYSDVQTLNGNSLDELVNPVNLPSIIPEFQQTNLTDANLIYAPAGLVNDVIRLDLRAHIFLPTLRYGLTDDWDIGLSVPILRTSLRVRTDARFVVETPDFSDPKFGGGFVFLPDADGNPDLRRGAIVDPNLNISTDISGLLRLRFVRSQRRTLRLAQSSGSATGIGDIILRSKYRVWSTGLGGVAWGLNLQLPSGDEDNFHGSGETHVTTFLYTSHVLWEQFEPHVNIGIDFNTADINRSSVVYAIGAAFQLHSQLGFGIDFIGRSEFAGLQVKRPRGSVIRNFPLSADPDACTREQPCFLDNAQPEVASFFFPESIKRNDIVDFSFGFRYILKEGGSVFFGGVVPLNDDGFRADFLPSGGIEYTF